MRSPRPARPARRRPGRPGDRPARDAVVAPPDPRSSGRPLDPVARVDPGRPPAAHRRRLWLRRIVRRAWLAAGAVLVAEVALLRDRARVVPIEILPALALAIADRRPRRASSASRRAARPRHRRDGHRPRRARPISATASRARSSLAAAFPDYAGPRVDRVADAERRRWPATSRARPRRSSAASGPTRRRRCGSRPRTCSGRGSRAGRRRRCSSRRSCSCPLVLLPNPQDAAIAQSRAIRDEANATGPPDRRHREGARVEGRRTRTIRGRSSRQSSATSPASSGPIPTT